MNKLKKYYKKYHIYISVWDSTFPLEKGHQNNLGSVDGGGDEIENIDGGVDRDGDVFLKIFP